MIRHLTHSCIAAVFLFACGRADAPQQPETPASTSAEAEFDAAVEAFTEVYFSELPEVATYVGAPDEMAPGADSRLIQRDPASENNRRARFEAALADLRALDQSGLDLTARSSLQSMIFILDGALAPARAAEYGSALSEYGVWFMPYAIAHNSGPTITIPSLLEAQHTIKSTADADTYLARLELIAPTLDGALDRFRGDVAAGAAPPDFIIERSLSVIDDFVAAPAEENVLHASFIAKLAAAEIAEADDYAAKARDLLANEVYPAYRRIGAYLREILPGAVHDAGVWRLPNGEALYRAMILHMTDTEMSPEELHRIGLEEVGRILAEMDAILKAQGYLEGTVGERMRAMAGEDRFIYPNTDEGKALILADIGSQLEAVNAEAPKWFGHLPSYGVEVRAVPKFSEETQSGGYYDPPALDGSRPGIYWINLRDTAVWPKFTVPTLTYHEAVPGHHFQVAVALEQDLPLISNALFSNASGEGWGLYAEALAAEMGLYDNDPYGDLGRLRDELHRAIRLVVDIGMHAMKWSREDAIRYLAETEGAEMSDVISEIERYAVEPGQALGYKVGMMKIQALRAEAESALGDEFDIREFHDEILKVSSFALPVIEAHIESWIAAKAGGN